MNSKVNILITCAGRRVELVKNFAAAREALSIDGKIFCCDADISAPALRFADEARVIPRIDSGNYIASIIEIAKKDEISIIIPTIDTELLLLSEAKNEIFEKTGAKVLISSPDVISICSDKFETVRFLQENGFATPETYSENELSNGNYRFPLFIKPRDGSSSVDAFKVRNKRELDFFLDYVKNPIVQKCEQGQEYTIDAFADFDSRFMAAIPRKRLATRSGEILKGQIDLNATIVAEIRRLISLLKPIGPITVQGFQGDDGIFRFTEINPRFGGGVPMSIAAGADFCKWVYMFLIGQTPTPATIRDGMLFSRFDQTIEILQDDIDKKFDDNRPVNTEVATRDFKFYIFDWDDNILKMPTCIHLEKLQPDGSWKPHRVSTSIYSVVRQDTKNYRFLNNSRDEAFKDFQDSGSSNDNTFLRETREAIKKVLSGETPPCPSFTTFRKTLVEGRLFAIVTARGHSPATLRMGVETFINEVLTDEERETMMANLRGYRYCYDGIKHFGSDREELDHYLSLNRYHAVTSPDFSDWLERKLHQPVHPEKRKQFAISDFVEHVIRIVEHSIRTGGTWRPVSVGFSDDDQGNIKLVQDYVLDALTKRFPDVKFCIYDTSDPSFEKGRKVTVSGQLGFDFMD